MWTNLEQQAQEEMKKKKEAKKEISCKEQEGKEEATEEKEEAVQNDNKTKLPDWLEKYIIYKFNLYDRTGICFVHTMAALALAS